MSLTDCLNELKAIPEDRDYIDRLEKLFFAERMKTQELEFKNSQLMQEIEKLKKIIYHQE